MLLTPGPLSTSKGVKAAMLQDWCTWDDDYNLEIVQNIRRRLIALATHNTFDYTSVLMQGSGTFAVESVLGTVIPPSGKLLIISNGAYGQRMRTIAKILQINHIYYEVEETAQPDLDEIENKFKQFQDITHISVVHCETTTGILNPVKEIASLCRKFQKVLIVDAMSSFGGIPLDMDEWGIDFLISSANKCIQGVPGFGFVIAKRELLDQCCGMSRSHSLDLFDQWQTMEKGNGKWRFTSPTHVVRAFYQALDELEEEGGISIRNQRYFANQKYLVTGMRSLGFETLLPDYLQSPVITSFISPQSDKYSFDGFYKRLKSKGFVIYPGKISAHDTFRIGTIGEIYPNDIEHLLNLILEIRFW